MATQLKHFFDKSVVAGLAKDFVQVYDRFDAAQFTRECLDGLDQLELHARAWHIAEVMRRHLPQEFPKAARILVKSLPNENQTESRDFGVFRFLPHVFYVSKYGLDHLEDSLDAQHALTQRFTAEFSIRPFIEKHPEATYARLRQWASDPNHHVRRLVSEGTRPRLPWAPRLREFQKNPAPVIALLELLKDDPELYVRRSVANNLNDIAKDHPETAVEVCRRWSIDATPERRWIIRHGLRSLVKKGHPGALALMGVGAKPKVTVSPARFTPKSIAVGDTIRFTFEIVSMAKKPQTLQVDYRVYFVKATGQTAPKVFKLRRIELAPGETATLESRVSFAPMTTRKHYPGVHRWEALVNGVPFALGEVRVK